MAGKFGMKDGTEYLPKYNHDGGMNDDLAFSDQAGWQTSVAMLTGGQPADWDDYGWLDVGPPYAMDPMGEIRDDHTFGPNKPMAMGKIGMGSTESAPRMGGQMTTTGGKSVNLSNPQTYSDVGLKKAP